MGELQDFLREFCQYIDINCRWTKDDVAILELSDEAASLVDGPRTPGYTCQLALSYESAQRQKDAKLFVPGSYHWDRFQEITLEKARFCRQYVVRVPGCMDTGEAALEADDGQLIYEPHLLAHWRLSYRTDHTTTHRILDLTVNLTSGDTTSGYYHSFLGCQLAKTPLPGVAQAKRRINIKKAYDYMIQDIAYMLAQEDATWALSASNRLQEELQALEKYYDQAIGTAPSDLLMAEKAMRTKELKNRLQPKVMASPFATALVYVPMIIYEARFDNDTRYLRFDPIIGQATGLH